jgi:hypothetical protein
MRVVPALSSALWALPALSIVLLALPALGQRPVPAYPQGDWLISGRTYKAALEEDPAHQEVTLTNGLVRRRFRIAPNAACVDYVNLSSGEQMLRAVTPEARLVLDGKTYAVGGLYGQDEKAYLKEETIDALKAHAQDFHCTGYRVSPLTPPIAWVSHTWTGNPKQATGIELILRFTGSNSMDVQVHYALYDNAPLICKWITLRNDGADPIKVDGLVSEILATPEEESAVVGGTDQMPRPHGLFVESNYAFNNAMRYDLSDQTTHWLADSTYTSQVNYDYKTPCVLEVYPPIGPGVILKKGDTLESIRTWELLMDSYDRERRGMSIKRMYRAVAPWTTQNPIFMHLVSKTDGEVTNAVDQCVATGYEAVILSFGSHCNMEDTTKANIERWKRLAAYAHQKGILIGGYSLFSSRHISDSDDVISPKTGKPGGAFFGFAPCYGSRWGLGYLQTIETFLQGTGFDIFENDGPYPGDVCASTTHPGHRGLDDSQWEQILLQKSLYHWCSAHGVYVNAPDWYFMDGTNKIALGYREVNFSLPRDQQVLLNRQNIYDGTWEKTPSMGWGFVPLTRYQGGGPEAVLEPLKDHLRDYEQLMVQYYGSGVQACYRGPRLYDTDSTRALVQRVLRWYKTYRTILNGDIIHLRRPDGRDWDGILHVDAQGPIHGFLLLYNPLTVPLTRTIIVPLYYTGCADKPQVLLRKGQGLQNRAAAERFVPGRDGTIRLRVTLPPGGYNWYTIE